MAKKSGLGRGLGSLMGEANAEVGRVPDSVLPITDVRPNKNQPRKNFDTQALNELTDSIRRNGILQPILVRRKGNAYEIVAGERRYQAARKAGLEEIPVIIREIDDDEVFQIAMIENLQRSDLNPIEEAQGYRTLINRQGLTQDELGRILSKSRSAIANTLRLLDLPTEIQDLMAEGQLSAGHARAILAVPSEDGRLRLAQKVIDDNLTVRQTETLAPLYSGNEEPRKKREPTPQYFKRAARQLRMTLETDVKVRRIRNKNKIEIEFNSEEELVRIVDALATYFGEADAR